MPTCAAMFCENGYSGKIIPGIRFHRFPLSKQELAKWLRKLFRKDFFPTAEDVADFLNEINPCSLLTPGDLAFSIGPPYRCPYPECDNKVYKSFAGIQTHFNKQHPKDLEKSQEPKKTVIYDGSAAGNGKEIEVVATPTSPTTPVRGGPGFPWVNTQRVVDVDFEGRIWRLNVMEPLEIVPAKEADLPPEEKWEAVLKHYREAVTLSPSARPPEAKFRRISEYRALPGSPMPASYIRHIEKSQEELDQEVEYDMDDEDSAWLKIMNERRAISSTAPVPESTFEFLMDRLEKESHFQTSQASILSGVSKECYGVPYIPEGQWLCRRCQLSPSMAVDCCLCPNKGGAFKQTSDGRWAHVICAIWVPEVHFANTVFLEPVEGMDNVPAARWKLKCIVCKQRRVGACIQCHKPNCYTAFHVTCAQSAGLYMRVEPAATRADLSPGGNPYSVRKFTYCDLHVPGQESEKNINGEKNGGINGNKVPRTPAAEEMKNLQERKLMSEQKIKKARKILAQRRNSAPNVSIPVIPKQRLDAITNEVKLAGKEAFVPRLVAYWTLKRESRFGVPLLRRLQVFHEKRKNAAPERDTEGSQSIRKELKLWKRMRQDLEKSRLLCELVRKRERLKLEYVQILMELIDRLLKPAGAGMTDTVEKIVVKDRFSVFTQPVTEDVVKGYSKIIKNPMDLSTMRKKAEQGGYKSYVDMQKDFKLMIDNCIQFNGRTGESGRFYWKYANRMKRLGYQVIKSAKALSESGSGSDAGNWASKQKLLKHLEIPLVSEEKQAELPSAQPLRSPTESPAGPSRATGVSPGSVGRKLQFAEGQALPKLEIKNETEKIAPESGSAVEDGESKKKKGPARRGPAVPIAEKKKKAQNTAPLLKNASETAKIVRRRRHPPSGFPLPPKKRKKSAGRSSAESSAESATETEPKKKAEESNAGEKRKKGGGSGNERQGSIKDFLEVAHSLPPSSIQETKPEKKGSGRASPKKEKQQPECSRVSRSRPAFVEFRSGEPSSPPSAASDSLDDSSWLSDDDDDGLPILTTSRIRASMAVRVGQGVVEIPQPPSPPPVLPPHQEERMEGRSTRSGKVQRRGKDGGRVGARMGVESAFSDDGSSRDSADLSSLQSGGEFSGGVLAGLNPVALDQVWAQPAGKKFWVPALVIDPNMPTTGYLNNGVPIMGPPKHVLDAGQKKMAGRSADAQEKNYLVHYFDAEEKWEWVAQSRILQFGLDTGLDNKRLTEAKRVLDKEMVKKAYDKAVIYRCRVTNTSPPDRLRHQYEREVRDTDSDEHSD